VGASAATDLAERSPSRRKAAKRLQSCYAMEKPLHWTWHGWLDYYIYWNFFEFYYLYI